MKKDLVVLLLSVLILLLVAGVLVFSSLKFFEEKNELQGKIKNYSSPGTLNPNGLNLVFFSDKYDSWESFDKDIDNLVSEIKKIEPWQLYNRINVYRIEPEKNDLCKVRTEGERKPMLICSEKIKDYLPNLERFKLIVLSRQKFESWANVVRLENSGIFFSMPVSFTGEIEKKAYGYLFAHLLGHSFGLKDEELFVIAKNESNALKPDGPNCAPDKITAEKLWGELAKQNPTEIGYFQECCGNKDYIKPTKSSLMNLSDLGSFTPDYGPVSGDYLEKILKYCFSEQKYSGDTDKSFFETYPEFKDCLQQ